MTPTLRRSHRIIWLVLAVLLPIGLIAALLLPKTGIPLRTGPVPSTHRQMALPTQP